MMLLCLHTVTLAVYAQQPLATSLPPAISQTPQLGIVTPVPHPDTAAVQIPSADFSPETGWSCGDFPCADDINGFLQRIRIPAGFELAHRGRFPGQVLQMENGIDGRLYATVLENSGTRTGAVYVMDAAGNTERYSNTLVSPIGLAFQPGTDTLYVSTRLLPDGQGGALWRIRSDGSHTLVRDDLPCCFLPVGNQPNGMIFGRDGWLYLGIGALTDHAEGASDNQYIQPRVDEAAILRINPHTGEIQIFANGLHNPFDIAQDSIGNFYGTDSGLLTGAGDRMLQLQPGGFYGWPFYRNRGCVDCPTGSGIDSLPDAITFPDFTLPRGLTVYTGTQFPGNMFDTLFVTLSNDEVQRVIWIDPTRLSDPAYVPQPFVTGLIRPIDVLTAPDGSLLVADFIYGHIWQVTYTGNTTTPIVPVDSATQPATPDITVPLSDISIPTATPEQSSAPGLFVTNTPDS